MCAAWRAKSNATLSTSQQPSHDRWNGAAGPADARQGSRCARPAPPAGGLDQRRPARRLTAMGRRLGASDIPAPHRNDSADKLAPFSGWSLPAAGHHGSSSKISKTGAVTGTVARRPLRLFAASTSTKGPSGKEGSFRVDRDRRLARRGPDHRGRDRGVRGLVRRPVRRIVFDPPLTPLLWSSP